MIWRHVAGKCRLTTSSAQFRDDWRKAEIVVTTVQSLHFNNKYQSHFSPTDFDLVISDEAHRSIGGNSRAVFEYFVGANPGLLPPIFSPTNFIQIKGRGIRKHDFRIIHPAQVVSSFAALREPIFNLQTTSPMTENEISKIVVDAAVKLHQDLGPGLLESVYEVSLAHLLTKRGLSCVRQLPVPICPKNHHLPSTR